MRLLGKLAEKVGEAKDKEEMKNIIANAGMELTDDELDMVSGGQEEWHNGVKYTQFYTIQSGDTLMKVARAYRISVNSLVAANDEKWKYKDGDPTHGVLSGNTFRIPC